MTRLLGSICTVIVLLLAVRSGDKFSNYKAIETYEIRPGIVMMPRYSPDGKVCEIGLERRHYSPEAVNLDSSLSRSEIDRVFDELVPAGEKGPKLDDFGANLIFQSGRSITTTIGYENVSFQIVSQQLATSTQDVSVEAVIVATIHWKNRKCE
jgi:hypothetical protein